MKKLGILLKRVCQSSLTVLYITPFIPIALLLHIISLFYKIRITPLFSARIGHFAFDTELHLCLREREPLQNGIELFCLESNEICNSQLLKMWRRVIPLYFWLRGVFLANQFLTKLIHPLHAKNYLLMNEPIGDKSIIKSGFNDTRPRLHFTDSEKQKGKKFIEPFLQDVNKGFVCIHSRSSVYMDTLFPAAGTHFHYHNYRDSDANDFIDASEQLVQEGYTVFRMGAVKEAPLLTKNPYIIDYANSYRNDFLDIYLTANCQFYVGDASGLNSVPTVFKVPIALTNVVPLYHFSWYLLKKIIFIPKLYWSHKKFRLLTFSEMLMEPFLTLDRSSAFEEFGIQLINNTPDEIAMLAKEMYLRHISAWQETPEDSERQKAFVRLLKNTRHYSPDTMFGKISSAFLKKYEMLF